MMNVRFHPLFLFGLVLFAACQGNGRSSPAVELTKLFGTNSNGRLLEVRRIDQTRFLTIRGSLGKRPRQLYVEEGETSRLALQPNTYDELFVYLSEIVNGKVIIASIVPLSGDESDSQGKTWWICYDVNTGKELYRKPSQWAGRRPATLYFGTTPLDAALNDDGSFTALVGFREGVRLQKYDSVGNFISETDIVPTVPSSPRLSLPLRAGKLYQLPQNEFLVVTSIYRGEAQSYANFAGLKTLEPTVGSKLDELIIVLRLNQDGKITSAVNLDFGKDSADLSGTSLKGDVLVIGGNYLTDARKMNGFAAVVKLSAGFANVASIHIKRYRLSDMQDRVVGVAQTPDGKILVAGDANINQVPTHSIVAAGNPYLSVLDASGAETAFQWLDKSSLEVVSDLSDDANGPLLLGQKNPPLTHGSSEKLATYLFSIKLK